MSSSVISFTRVIRSRNPNLVVYQNFNSNCVKRTAFDKEKLKIAKMSIDPCNNGYVEKARKELLRIFAAGVTSVLPAKLIETRLKLIDDNLVLDNREKYPLTDNVYIVGFGKAVAGMACSLEQILGDRLKSGILSLPKRTFENLNTESELQDLRTIIEGSIRAEEKLREGKAIDCYEGAVNNQADGDSVAATERIVQLASRLGSDDTLLVLISGGGSALLCQPVHPVDFAAKSKLCRELQNSGADIRQLNALRCCLSSVKAGGLARIAHPAKVIALVLSDIVGDPVETIASGPTSYVDTENLRKEVIKNLRSRRLFDKCDPNVKNVLLNEVRKEIDDDRVMLAEGQFKHVKNIVIGSNTTSLEAAANLAKERNIESIILSNSIEGNVKDVSQAYAKLTKLVCCVLNEGFSSEEAYFKEMVKQKIDVLNISEDKARYIYQTLHKLGKDRDVLLLGGGEPTVTVEGNGKGGRNQELALRFSLDWLDQMATYPALTENCFVLFLSAGTDGQDGPTDAAGAFGWSGLKLQDTAEISPETSLKNNDSYNFFKKSFNGKYFLKCGLTGTNVMDLHFIYLKKKHVKANL